MTDYKPTPGERAVFHGSAVGSIEVHVADYRGHFTRVGEYRPAVPSLAWIPYAAHSATEVRTLDPETQAWAWDTLVEAKRRHEAGEPLADMATHRFVPNRNRVGMHLAPIDPEEPQ